jgi:hypothetical protein
MHTPQHLVVRLGEDFNWWLAPSPDDNAPRDPHGVVDPRQLRDLVERLAEYRAHGLDPSAFENAFRFYSVDAELGDNTLRLEHNDDGDELFAVPVIDEDNDGAYPEFLDALGAARVRRLNAEHEYARPCTFDEMRDELDALDHDRYFNDDTIHAFEQISEILNWSPAEWDQP